MSKNIVLIGYMGSGKSSTAQILAKKLNAKWLDLDTIIAEKEKKSITELFRTKGEIYFRKLEATSLQEILAQKNNAVISIGGGTPCYGNNLKFIQETPNTVIIYLNTSIDTLTERLFKERKSRPLIAHLQTKEALNDFIRKHLFERSFFYNQADMQVKNDGKSPEETADEIYNKLF